MEPSPQAGDERQRFDAALRTALAAMGCVISETESEVMFRHYQLVVEANQRFNLTRITSPEEAAVKHYADSLSLLTIEGIDRAETLAVLDIGTGAGFPAVPLAIACRAWSVHAIDGTGKKVAFVADTARRLGLGNLRATQARAETMKREARHEYDLVLMRAVTDAARGISLAADFIVEGGLLVLYKTAHLTVQEQRAAEQTARRLRLQPLPAVPVTLSDGLETFKRLLLVYQGPE